MHSLPKLDFPPVRLRAKRCAGGLQVWDTLRGTWLVLTPEEWVRRHLIAFLTDRCAVPPQSVCQEYAVELNGQRQRADVVVCDRRGKPWLLAECKAAEVSIDSGATEQAIRYNSVLGARYVLVTNGMVHRCLELSDSGYVPVAGVPRYE